VGCDLPGEKSPQGIPENPVFIRVFQNLHRGLLRHGLGRGMLLSLGEAWMINAKETACQGDNLRENHLDISEKMMEISHQIGVSTKTSR